MWAGGDAPTWAQTSSRVATAWPSRYPQAERGGDDGGEAFDWDIMIDVGDMSGSRTPPDDEEGEEVVRQYAASTKHPREHFYNLVGNYDASGVDEPLQWWFPKWLDPIGENPESSGIWVTNRHPERVASSSGMPLGPSVGLSHSPAQPTQVARRRGKTYNPGVPFYFSRRATQSLPGEVPPVIGKAVGSLGKAIDRPCAPVYRLSVGLIVRREGFAFDS